MKCVGIDLSLRSTGLVSLNGEEIHYKLVTSNSKNLNDEELLLYNWNEIKKFIEENNPSHIGLEGLSFGSISSSKDILAGNFWFVRAKIHEEFPNVIFDIIPVLTWRSPLFNKEERKLLKENEAKVKELKREIMKSDKETKKLLLAENEELILSANIKFLTWEKLPEDIGNKFRELGFNHGCFDLSDAYFIADFMRTKYDRL